MSTYIPRGLVVWLVIILAESIHGTLRTIFLQPILGDLQARQVSVISGAILVFAITYIFSNWIKAEKVFQLLTVGVIWVILTVCFEMSLGRLILGYSWDRIFQDYRIADGGFLGFGLLFMALSPVLAAKLHRLIAVRKGDMYAKHN